MYELPLTVRIDTLIAPARFVPEPGVTLEDLEQARAQMPEGWVPVDSWNTPGNLFGLLRAVLYRRIHGPGNGDLPL